MKDDSSPSSVTSTNAVIDAGRPHEVLHVSVGGLLSAARRSQINISEIRYHADITNMK